jgi:thiol-disulfide isomerase/thioredoxin
MPVICLGPVCIPIYPLVILVLKPIWNILPESVRAPLRKVWTPIWNVIGPYYTKLENLLGLGKKKKKDEDSSASACENSDIVSVESQKHWDEILASAKKANQPVIADFSATWCKPCKKLWPSFQEVAAVNKGKATFVKVDFDDAEEVAISCDVAAIPQVHAYLPSGASEKLKGGDLGGDPLKVIGGLVERSFKVKG